MTAIINATLVMRDHLIPNGVLLMENGKITAFGESRKLEIPEGCEIIDAEGKYVGPGFVDLHTHSDGKVFFYDDPKSVGHHLKHGTTTILAALYFSMTTEEFVDAMGKIREAMKDPDCKNLCGIYMEGPYMNPKFGCDKEHNPWIGPVDKEKYQPIIDAGWDLVKVWGLAPERENITEFVQAVKAKNPAAVFSVAHSEASPQQVEALMPYGLKIGTHHTNATGDRIFYPEVRGVCVDEAVNYNREIYAELICDSMGIHVDPYMLRLVRRIKGDDRIILISDAYACDGPVPPGYDGVDDINFDWSGEIAGSKLTLDIACRNALKHLGASIVDVFRFASYNPAMAVGFYDRGEIAVGKRADLVIVDHWMKVNKVIFEGKVQNV
jgi:N-acetylglucosamine-6-phosphate deacetylase